MRRLAGHRKHPEARAHERQQAQADIAATDDQQARLAEAPARFFSNSII